MTTLLDPRMETFCHIYLSNQGNGRAAAIDSGYAIVSASVQANRLLKRPDVLARIEELRNKQKTDKDVVRRVNREWVVARMIEEAEKAERSGDRIKALHYVGIELGAFVERKMEIQNPLDGLTADQLLALLRVAEDMQRQAGIEHQPKPSSTMIAHTSEPDYIEAETIDLDQPSDDELTTQAATQETLKDS